MQLHQYANLWINLNVLVNSYGIFKGKLLCCYFLTVSSNSRRKFKGQRETFARCATEALA